MVLRAQRQASFAEWTEPLRRCPYGQRTARAYLFNLARPREEDWSHASIAPLCMNVRFPDVNFPQKMAGTGYKQTHWIAPSVLAHGAGESVLPGGPVVEARCLANINWSCRSSPDKVPSSSGDADAGCIRLGRGADVASAAFVVLSSSFRPHREQQPDRNY